jgi:hypothetical protein
LRRWRRPCAGAGSRPISPIDRSDLAREAGIPVSEPEPRPEDLDMELIMKILAKHGMEFLEDGEH